MQIIKFTTLPEGKNTESFLNGLKPVQEEQKQVILDVVENDDYIKKYIDSKNSNSITPYLKSNLHSLRRLEIIKNEDDIDFILKNKNIFDFLNSNDINILTLLLKDKGLNSMDNFFYLYQKGLFENINFTKFLENISYLEDKKGSKIEMSDLTPNMVGFLKCADLDGIDFILGEYSKQEYSLEFNNIYDLIKIFDGTGTASQYKQIIFYILSFVSQPGLYQKVKYMYSKKSEEFNFGQYFSNVHSADSLDVIGNTKVSYSSFLEKYENKSKNIDNFKKSLDILIDKFPDLEINDENFQAIERLGDNLFLLNYFKDDIIKYEDVLILYNFIKYIFISSDKLKKILQFDNIDFKLIQNKNFINFLDDSSLKVVIEIIGLYSDKKSLSKIFENKIDIKDLEELISYFTNNRESSGYLKEIFFNRLDKKYSNFKKIIDKNLYKIERILFNDKSNGSKIFDEIIYLMKEKPEENLYNIMSKRINEEYDNIVLIDSIKYSENDRKENQKRIIKNQEILFQKGDIDIGNKLEINEEELDLSIYLRYTHTVDAPEVAEYIIMFLEKYFREGNSKYFKNIRIIPREIDRFPDNGLFEGRNIKKYNVEEDEFKIGLHKNSIAMFFSHSTNSNPYNSPQLVSGSMEDNISDIKLSFDLEKNYCNEYVEFISNKDLKEILEEVLYKIRILEKELDKIN